MTGARSDFGERFDGPDDPESPSSQRINLKNWLVTGATGPGRKGGSGGRVGNAISDACSCQTNQVDPRGLGLVKEVLLIFLV